MKKEFETALSAIYRNDLEEFESIVDKMDNIDYLDKTERSLLFHAILQNDIDFVDLLIAYGAKVNLKDKEGWSPLHYAANEHLLSITKSLVKANATINAKDSYGNTVIWRAVFASKGRGEIIEFLLENKADPSIKNDSGISAKNLANTIGNYNIKQFFDTSEKEI